MLLDVKTPEVSLAVATGSRIALARGPRGDSAAIVETLRSQRHEIVMVPFPGIMSQETRFLVSTLDMVLVDITVSARDVLGELERLNAIIGICRARPRKNCSGMQSYSYNE